MAKMAESKIPKTIIPAQGSGFGIGNIIGLIFVLIGILLVLSLMNFNLPVKLENFKAVIQYGAAIGSVLGGLSMLFKKNEPVSSIKLK